MKRYFVNTQEFFAVKYHVLDGDRYYVVDLEGRKYDHLPGSERDINTNLDSGWFREITEEEVVLI